MEAELAQGTNQSGHMSAAKGEASRSRRVAEGWPWRRHQGHQAVSCMLTSRDSGCRVLKVGRN